MSDPAPAIASGLHLVGDLHLLRPWWLLALLPAAVLGWRILAANDPAAGWRRVVAPHLLPYLLIGGGPGGRYRFGPAQALLAVWAVAIIALSGPAWRREPSPFASDRAVLALVVKVAPSMRTDDIQPDRLARAAQKIGDLLTGRPGDDAALVAYAGSAHVVLPATADADLVRGFAADLDPAIMPVPGDDPASALDAAAGVIAAAKRPGAVLWIADAADASVAAGLRAWRAKHALPVTVLAVAAEGPELESLRAAAGLVDATVVPVSPDDADLRALTGARRFALETVGEAGAQRWQDAGWWLVPVIAALLLLWIRPGWMPRSAARGAA